LSITATAVHKGVLQHRNSIKKSHGTMISA